MDEGRKRVLWISASILAAPQLAAMKDGSNASVQRDITYDAILKAGFSASMADEFFNPLHGYIGSYHYRSDGDPGTGENSGHLIIRGVTILHPWDTVPTNGELHFGETNPNVNRIEHFRKDVF